MSVAMPGYTNEEEDELSINDHYGVLGYSVNNYFTAYTGV